MLSFMFFPGRLHSQPDLMPVSHAQKCHTFLLHDVFQNQSVQKCDPVLEGFVCYLTNNETLKKGTPSDHFEVAIPPKSISVRVYIN